MKKRLLLLPLIGGFILTGCEFTVFGKTIKLFEKNEEAKNEEKQKQEGENEGQEEEQTPVTPPVILEEFGDYKLAKEVKEGGKYVLGVYKEEGNIIRFFNGDYHRDDNSFYPFYMGTGTENIVNEDSLAKAAEITVHFVSDDEFTMQVSTSDESLPWNGKYIGVYSAISGYDNKVMSVALMDDPDQTSYTCPKTHKKTDLPSAKFKYHVTCNEQTVYAPAADYKYIGVDDTAVPKFLGTTGDYHSMDCKSFEIATDGAEYNLAHLYEHK